MANDIWLPIYFATSTAISTTTLEYVLCEIIVRTISVQFYGLFVCVWWWISVRNNGWPHMFAKGRRRQRPHARRVDPIQRPKMYPGQIRLRKWDTKPVWDLHRFQVFVDGVCRLKQQVLFVCGVFGGTNVGRVSGNRSGWIG